MNERAKNQPMNGRLSGLLYGEAAICPPKLATGARAYSDLQLVTRGCRTPGPWNGKAEGILVTFFKKQA